MIQNQVLYNTYISFAWAMHKMQLITPWWTLSHLTRPSNLTRLETQCSAAESTDLKQEKFNINTIMLTNMIWNIFPCSTFSSQILSYNTRNPASRNNVTILYLAGNSLTGHSWMNPWRDSNLQYIKKYYILFSSCLYLDRKECPIKQSKDWIFFQTYAELL